MSRYPNLRNFQVAHPLEASEKNIYSVTPQLYHIQNLPLLNKPNRHQPKTDMSNTRRFIIQPGNLSGDTAVISGREAHHLRSVLRLTTGDTIVLLDGAGFEYKALITTCTPQSVVAAIQAKHTAKNESLIRITVGQALLKEKKMDVLARQMTELGIHKWIPFTTQRSVPRLKAGRALSRTRRWEKIALEALKQCNRGRTPEILPPLPFNEMLDHSRHCALRLAFWENAVADIPPPPTNPITDIMVLFGPEGGFTTKEIETARRAGFVTATLGPRILRAETASVAGCALLQYLFGDMSQNHLDKKPEFA